ncbi:TIR domain-containing protein [Pseudaeromonas paramecii]|uniref:CD-NTase-associated protein 12/Pycsar effector protein TIR domain-containing protein n=1 Tax=Pseudaeromonas paramecii TaxID=2138166 RepID=A0ABP8PY46_9GAMM
MKPRVFIGSSVEGLNVAYAIQQNLTHDAEPTVWDQGVFELSLTSIETLTKVVEESDFGVFVFSPDDITKMRSGEHNSIRDNVLFEYGLFTGKLGRERVFFITPEGSSLHIPTDLLGITPGVYNPHREDGRLQAATGPACNQIREAIKKLPNITSNEISTDPDESKGLNGKENDEWIIDLLKRDYKSARDKLTAAMVTKEENEQLIDKAWMVYIDFKEDAFAGLEKMLQFASTHKDDKKVLCLISSMLSWESYYEQALDLINRTLEAFKGDTELLIIKADIYACINEKDKAIALLSDNMQSMNPDVAITLSELYEKDNLQMAVDTIHAAYVKHPGNKAIAFKYSRLLQDNNQHKEAVGILNNLCINDPNNSDYLGYISNSCVQLNLYEMAMTYLKRANDVTKESKAWIMNNIGNILNNKGLYSEAEFWLTKGLEIDRKSEYAYDRITSAIKNRNKEIELFQSLCTEGLHLIREKTKTTSMAQ